MIFLFRDFVWFLIFDLKVGTFLSLSLCFTKFDVGISLGLKLVTVTTQFSEPCSLDLTELTPRLSGFLFTVCLE